MQDFSRGKISLISCEGGRPFASQVAMYLEEILMLEKSQDSAVLIDSKEKWFSNGEVKTELEENARNQDVYIIQDAGNTTITKHNRLLGVNDHFMALKTAIDSAKRADVHYITAVIPYFPYGRQDRKKSREGITAKQIAMELELAGANRVITLDIHNEAIEGFFNTAKFENLRASKYLLPYIKKNVDLSNLLVVAPDNGAVGRNEYFAKNIGAELRIVYKKRDYSKENTIDELTLLGEVDGKDTLVVDDMIDSAGTILEVSLLLRKAGAKKISLATSLPIFSGPAKERLEQSYHSGLITGVIGTNAIYHGQDFSARNPWYYEVSVAELFADAIYNVNRGKSIRSLHEP